MLRFGFVMCMVAVLPCGAFSQDQEKLARRYRFDMDLNLYPQKSPQEAILSVTRAIDARRIDYMLAQLSDPNFVDERVAEYKKSFRNGSDEDKTFLAFDRLVDETRKYFLEDPTFLKELRRFSKEGEWQTTEAQAVGSLKDIQGRKVFLRKLEGRWFLENRQQ